MAELLSNEVETVSPADIITGSHIIDIISSGMYNDPKMVLREYIQNSSDSLDEAIRNGLITESEAKIHIELKGKERILRIRDNGVGVSRKKLKRTLCSIASSEKEQSDKRGFRGIGRLGALGYCETLIFETKTLNDSLASRVTWDAKSLNEKLQARNPKENLAELLSSCITVTQGEFEHQEPNYFEVTMIGVKRFHNDDLMHLPTIRNYLSLHAPLPFSDKFVFKTVIEDHLRPIHQYKTYPVFLNGKQIFKPHIKSYKISSKKSDSIQNIISFILYDRKREVEIGRGWYAITGFEALIPKSNLMRGIIIRQGNILVADDSYLAEFFDEKRFAAWCIGEVHVTNSVIANARRDGFEHTNEYESLIEQFTLLGGHLSTLIRKASEENTKSIYTHNLQRRINTLNLKPVAIDMEHKELLVNAITKSQHKDQQIIIENISLIQDILKEKKLLELEPSQIIEKIQTIARDKKYDPLFISELLTEIVNSFFIDKLIES